MHATFVTLCLQVMQPLANVHETKWTPHVKREIDVAVHIIAVVIHIPIGMFNSNPMIPQYLNNNLT